MLQINSLTHSHPAMPYLAPVEADERAEARHPVNLEARMRQGLHLAIDSSAAVNDGIADVVVTDISYQGLSATGTGALMAGQRAMVEVPLIGCREVEVRWIAGNRAGCRFVRPLSDEELRMALCRSSTLAECFPGLLNGLSGAGIGRA